MSRHDYADLTIVLDRSGSMSYVKTDTIGGFNQFLADQKAAPGHATLTLCQFDHEFEVVHGGKAVKDVPALDDTTFVPRGNTALLDAVGRAINETGARLAAMADHDRPGKVIFVILTDGQENASHEYDRAKVFEMITHQREVYGWEFVFLGANQDAIKTGAALGVKTANSMTYAANSVGTQEAFASTSANAVSFRTGRSGGMAYSDKDREAQVKAGAK